MPDTIDWPRLRGPRRRRFLPMVVLVILVALVFVSRIAMSYYVDALWFGSLGYGGVFWKKLDLEWTIFAVFAITTFLVLYISFLALKRAYLGDLPGDHTIFIGDQPLKLPVGPVMRVIAL